MVLGNKSSSPPSLGEQRGALSAKSVLYLEKRILDLFLHAGSQFGYFLLFNLLVPPSPYV